MSQSAPELSPASAHAPAPWELEARGYILVLKLPEAMLDTGCFVPEALRAARVSSFAYVMLVDYLSSPVGPYHELLLIPSAFRVGERRHWSITKIYVSTQASVDNGRRNWGIPKELASFEVEHGDGRVDRVAMRVGGEAALELTLRHHPFGVPLIGGVFPSSMRSLSQELDGTRFTFAPGAHGALRLGKLLQARIDPRFFPAFEPSHAIAVAKVPSMHMTFPVAQVERVDPR